MCYIQQHYENYSLCGCCDFSIEISTLVITLNLLVHLLRTRNDVSNFMYVVYMYIQHSNCGVISINKRIL